MWKEPRRYSSQADLDLMTELLIQGRMAANGSYYVHPGDLFWWLFYSSKETELWEYIYLWESVHQERNLDGWALINPILRTFDVFVKAGLRGSDLASEMYAWAEERATEIVARRGGKGIRTMWILEDDAWVTDLLIQRGFSAGGSSMACLLRPLEERLALQFLPDGYQVRSLKGEQEINARAIASRAAFQSSMPMEGYIARYLKFMRSPVYDPELDLVVTTPGGQVAAFCNCWLDRSNQVGLFEPVGTHPDYRRKGIGKALVNEGLRRMKQRGMRQVIVVAEEDNQAAKKLYASTGFNQVNKLVTYAKDL